MRKFIYVTKFCNAKVSIFRLTAAISQSNEFK